MSFFSMGKTLLRSIFIRPDTIPLSQLGWHRQLNTRGHVENEVLHCIFCGQCDRKCPTHAIKVQKADSQWAIDRFLCIQCNCCVDVCPVHCLHMDSEQPGVALEMGWDIMKMPKIKGESV